jgi:hypothetical protein
MIKLTNLLRELFTVSKNTANFELLAERKINEIESMLDEGKYDYIGTDEEKAKEAIETWRAEWKSKNPDEEEEPTSSNLKSDLAEKGGNNVLWTYIKTNFINNGKATWSDFGFPVVREKNIYSKTIGTDIEKAKEAVEIWRKKWKKFNPDKKEPFSSNLESDSKEKGGDNTLWKYIKANIFPLMDGEDFLKWGKFGFPVGREENIYSKTIGTDIKKAKEAVEIWRKKWKLKNPDKEPNPTNLSRDPIEKGGDNTLYNYIKANIFPLMDGEDYQNWHKLGLKSQIYWSKYTKEDFKEHIKQLKLVYPEFEKNNYIYELLDYSLKLYHGISGYMRKQNFNNVQRRNFWNDIGMQYVPQSEKLIYAYEFININGVDGDNRVYVGLTNDPNRRYGEHIKIGSYKSSLNDFKVDIENQEKIIKQEETIKARENPEILKKEKNKLTAVSKFLKEHPEITSEQINYIIKTDFMNAYEAADKESEILNGYLNDKKMNWKKLNIAKTGSLGGGYNSARKSNLKTSKEERNKASDEIARNIVLLKNK